MKQGKGRTRFGNLFRKTTCYTLVISLAVGAQERDRDLEERARRRRRRRKERFPNETVPMKKSQGRMTRSETKEKTWKRGYWCAKNSAFSETNIKLGNSPLHNNCTISSVLIYNGNRWSRTCRFSMPQGRSAPPNRTSLPATRETFSRSFESRKLPTSYRRRGESPSRAGHLRGASCSRTEKLLIGLQMRSDSKDLTAEQGNLGPEMD